MTFLRFVTSNDLRWRTAKNDFIGSATAGAGNRAARGIRLLQTELLARCQQCKRFANTPFPGVRPFGRVNPNDAVTSVGWCQLPKELPSFGIGLNRCREVIR